MRQIGPSPEMLRLRVDVDGTHHLSSTLEPALVANLLRGFAELVEKGLLRPPAE